MNIGFSTGALYPQYTVPQALEVFRDLNISIVELGIDILKLADSFDFNILKSFEYVSLHAPKFPYNTDQATHELFAQIEQIHAARPLDLVVFHPDTVQDFATFREAPFPIGFENMDKNKQSHQTAQELKTILDLDRSWKLVLDVNHIFTNDPTMQLIEPFYELLRDRIGEIHLSGYTKLHDPLFETKQTEIIAAVRTWDVPVIIESQLSTPENLAREREYIESIVSPAVA